MNKSLFYILFPVAIFSVHYTYLHFIFSISHRKKLVGIINIALYPVLMATITTALLGWFATNKTPFHLPSTVLGIVFCYLSLIFSTIPGLSILFQEVDIQYLLLGLGCAMGYKINSLNQLTKNFGDIFSLYGFHAVLAFIMGVIGSLLVKYLITKNLSASSSKNEVIKGIILGFSVSTGIVAIPVAAFFASIIP